MRVCSLAAIQECSRTHTVLLSTTPANFDIGLFSWPRLFERWIALSSG